MQMYYLTKKTPRKNITVITMMLFFTYLFTTTLEHNVFTITLSSLFYTIKVNSSILLILFQLIYQET